MPRTPPQELEDAFALFRLSTEEQRRTLCALGELGSLVEHLTDGSRTSDVQERELNAELARTTARFEDSR